MVDNFCFQEVFMDLSYWASLAGSMVTGGLGITCSLFFVTIVLSLPLGLGLSFLRVSRSKFLKGFSGFYVWILRGTPLLLQLFFFYFGLPFLPVIGPFLTMNRFQAAIIAFVLNYAAYFAEIFRGGIISIDTGQREAAKVLGYNRFQTTTKIIIPQMLRVCLPAISNETITLVKDTALVTAIGVADLLFFAKSAVNRDVDPTAFVVAAVFYLAMTFLVTQLFRWLEKKFAY